MVQLKGQKQISWRSVRDERDFFGNKTVLLA
jgi:hypothetical protein